MSGVATLFPLLVSVAFLIFSTNLQGVLLPILGLKHGVSLVAIGLYSSAWSAGFTLACVLIVRLLGRFGHVRVFVVLALASAVSASLLLFYESNIAWITLRVLTGFCFGGLSTIVESWLIERQANATAFSSYMIVKQLASLGGTLCLYLIDSGSAVPFVLMSAMMAMSTIPIMLAGSLASKPVKPLRPDMNQLWLRSPLGVLGVGATGLTTGAFGGLGPVFAINLGFTMGGNTHMLVANACGGILAYALVGLIAEQMNQRLLLGLFTLLGLVVCVPLVYAPHKMMHVELIGLFILFGFAQYPLYGICVSMVMKEAGGISATHISSELLLLFGLGTTIGPAVAERVNHIGLSLFAFVAVVLTVLLVAIVMHWLLTLRPSQFKPNSSS